MLYFLKGSLLDLSLTVQFSRYLSSTRTIPKHVKVLPQSLTLFLLMCCYLIHQSSISALCLYNYTATAGVLPSTWNMHKVYSVYFHLAAAAEIWICAAARLISGSSVPALAHVQLSYRAALRVNWNGQISGPG